MRFDMTCSQNWDFVMEVGSKDESAWCGMMASAADKIVQFTSYVTDTETRHRRNQLGRHALTCPILTLLPFVLLLRIYSTLSPPYQSFADVPITDAGVDTLAFLSASQGVVGLFGVCPFACRSPRASSERLLEISLAPPHSVSSNLT
jgi:hypothetical protein